MILAADISNAHITLGCIGSRGVYFTSRFATLVQKTEDEYAVDFYRGAGVKRRFRRRHRRGGYLLGCPAGRFRRHPGAGKGHRP